VKRYHWILTTEHHQGRGRNRHLVTITNSGYVDAPDHYDDKQIYDYLFRSQVDGIGSEWGRTSVSFYRSVQVPCTDVAADQTAA